MSTLRTTSEDHHARLVPHVDRLLVLAEMVGTVDCSALHALFEEEYAFIVGQLVPHMEAIETTLYGRLEQLMDGRHSMAPMRQEHEAMAPPRRGARARTARTPRAVAGARSRGSACGGCCTGSTRSSRSTSPRRSCTSASSTGT